MQYMKETSASQQFFSPTSSLTSLLIRITMASSRYPHSTSSSVTLAEAASTHPTEPHKLQDPIKTQDLEASRSDAHAEAPSTSNKAPLSTIRKHVLLALFAMVGDPYNIGLC